MPSDVQMTCQRQLLCDCRPSVAPEDAPQPAAAQAEDLEDTSTSEIMEMIEELVEEAGAAAEAVSLTNHLILAETISKLCLLCAGNLGTSSISTDACVGLLLAHRISHWSQSAISMVSTMKPLQGPEEAEETGEALKAQVDGLTAQLRQSEEALKSAQERYIRLNADFDNFRKRSVSEM